jgi:uncharacterized protein (DUF58 family)
MIWLLMLVACATLLGGRTAAARELVSGRYISSAGNNIILDLEVKGPSAANLIVHQFLPPEVGIVSSTPPVMKFDPRQGRAQWLMKKVPPGKVRIAMELTASIPPGSIRAEVRCRDQETGQMMDITINP